MQADPAFFPPLAYSPTWAWTGGALLALVLAWYVFVFTATRKPRRPAAGGHTVALTDPSGLKAAYVQRIDDVEREAAAGTISARAAHQAISLLLRSFVRDASGVDASRMTRDDLERHPLPAAAAAIGAIYPGEFGPEPLPPVTATAAGAREAVRTWT